MSEAPLNEPLAQFPELARARSLFIVLFKDDSPLINLGYTGGQRRETKPVLILIQESGEVLNPETTNQSLYFVDDSGQQFVEIALLPKDAGFSLFAAKDPVSRGLVGLLGALTTELHPPVFDDSFAVAQINLVRQNTIERDLSRLIPAFYEEGYALPQLKPDSLLSRAGRMLGKTTTFRAQWTDDIQRDFVVELKPPTSESKEGYYHHWRRLAPLSDFQGTVVPIGRKPNSSKDQILETLNRQPERAFQGQIQWQPRALVTAK